MKEIHIRRNTTGKHILSVTHKDTKELIDVAEYDHKTGYLLMRTNMGATNEQMKEILDHLSIIDHYA